jgi:hypothetical protein
MFEELKKLLQNPKGLQAFTMACDRVSIIVVESIVAKDGGKKTIPLSLGASQGIFTIFLKASSHRTYDEFKKSFEKFLKAMKVEMAKSKGIFNWNRYDTLISLASAKLKENKEVLQAMKQEVAKRVKNQENVSDEMSSYLLMPNIEINNDFVTGFAAVYDLIIENSDVFYMILEDILVFSNEVKKHL